MATDLDPYDVFTPGKIPLTESSVYVSRADTEQALLESMKLHWIPIVFGEYGVGKTTVVRHFLLNKERKQKLVYFASAAGLTLSAIFTRCLEHLDYREEVSREQGLGADASVGMNLQFLKVKAGANGSETVTHQLAVRSPTDARIISLLSDAGIHLVIDELHRASAEFREELTIFLKATRTDADGLQVILIGTSSDARQLVEWDEGNDRFISETEVPLLREGEAKAIIVDGFEKLGLSISQDLLTRVHVAAAGAPTIVQILGLHMAQSMIKDGRAEANEQDIERAIERYLKSHASRMSAKYVAAVETFGARRYRKQILDAIARLDREYATLEDIREGVSQALGVDVPSTALSGSLGALKSEKFGRILSDVERNEGGRIYSLSAFTDPTMKAFVRFASAIEAQGYELPSEA